MIPAASIHCALSSARGYGRARVLAAAVLLLLVHSQAWAASADLAAQLQKTYRRIVDLQADFVRTLRFADFETPSVSSGQLFLRRTSDRGTMRWDEQSPVVSQMFIDGETLLHYTPEHKQVLKGKMGSDAASAVAFRLLSGMGDLKRDFTLSTPDKTPGVLRLIPKANLETFLKIDVTTTPFPEGDGVMIQGVALHDANGNLTTFSFQNIRTNTGLKADLFHFVPPKGVEVIEQP